MSEDQLNPLWQSELLKLADIKFEMDIDLTRFSTLRLRARGDLIRIESLKALKEVLKILSSYQLKYKVLGNGSNQLLPEFSKIPYIKLEIPFEKSLLEKQNLYYNLPASVPLNGLTAHARKFGLKGWEVFTGIPASLGGAVYMNAGTELGEISQIVKKVWLVDKTGIERIITIESDGTQNNSQQFGYRRNHFCQEGDIIYQVQLTHLGNSGEIPSIIKNYLLKRTLTQPLNEKTCGCVFKNNSLACRAGHLNDILNLKGFEYKGIRISPTHGNFFENRGSANYSDFKEFIEIVQSELKLQFGRDFELEVKL